ncbi:hypothetical protein [Afipia birgiae]|uniref:hypothetical protein n=1 Tax=Afipia birgiae TaxID=151414 RepID=UPI0002EBED4D|nr:hypothetical protein [Afipia birgiae]
MTDFEILLLINANETATKALSSFTDAFKSELTDNGYRPHDKVDGVAANVKPLIAFYLANALAWATDRSGHVRYKRSPGDDAQPPSQVDRRVITELQFLAEFMSKPPEKSRVKGRTSISLYAVRELQKGAVLGSGVVSHAQKTDLAEQMTPSITSLGLGGQLMLLPRDGSVFGFDAPGMITDDSSSNARLVDRLTARAADAGETSLLKITPVRWELSPAVAEILLSSTRTHRGRHVCLRDVKRRLDDDGRRNLAFCAGQAMQLLKIAFQMTEPGDVRHSNKTVEQWLHAPPLSRFIVGVFELLTPTLGVPFDEIRLARNIPRTKDEVAEGENFDRLTKSAWDLASAGHECAKAIVKAIPELHGTDLDIGVGLMEISEGEQRKGRQDRKASGRPETTEEIESRLAAGRDILIAKIWSLRHDMLTLRGYAVFFDWYSAALMEPLPPLLFCEFLRQIFNEIQDWHRELEARYKEGILYKRDIKRHAGGMPLDVPELAPLVQRHTLEMMEYPLNRGYGAAMNQEIIQSLLTSLSAKHRNVLNIWEQVTELVDPIPVAEPA